jgi:WD40 repeat protein
LRGGIGAIGLHLVFSPDGRRLAVTEFAGMLVRVWEVATGREVTKVGSLPGRPPMRRRERRASFSPDGKFLAFIDDQQVRLFEVSTGRQVEPNVYGWHGGSPSWAAFNPDGKSLAAIGDVGPAAGEEIRIWDRNAGAVNLSGTLLGGMFSPSPIMPSGPLAALLGSVFSPDGRLLALPGPGPVRRQRRPLL